MHGGSPRQLKPDTEHVVELSAVCPDICPPTNYPHSYTCSKCIHTPPETCNNVARAPCINIVHECTNAEPTNNHISDHMLKLVPLPSRYCGPDFHHRGQKVIRIAYRQWEKLLFFLVYIGSHKLIWQLHCQMCGENNQDIIIELIKMVGMQPQY